MLGVLSTPQCTPVMCCWAHTLVLTVPSLPFLLLQVTLADKRSMCQSGKEIVMGPFLTSGGSVALPPRQLAASRSCHMLPPG